jgi:transcriptional regulator with XRE-family HTH domain
MAAARKGKDKDRDTLALFADELKAHRTAHGWTQADLAAKVMFSESLIAQVETCRKSATPDLAKALDRVFGTPGFTDDTSDGPGAPGTFGRLVTRLRNLPFPASFRSFATHEAEAAALSSYQHSLVPGLLQTEDYARAVMETRPNTTAEEIEEQVRGRLDRQAVLTRNDPPTPLLLALLDEGVLHRPVAPPGVMYAQMYHLIEVSRRPNITVQVVPYEAGGHTGLLGSFSVAEMGNRDAIVFVEDIADGRVFEDDATLSLVALRFKSLQSEALPKGASRELIARVAEQRWKEQAPSTGASQPAAATTGVTASRQLVPQTAS